MVHRHLYRSVIAPLFMAPVLSGAAFSMDQSPPAGCIAALRVKYDATPAFKIHCESDADCSFEPSLALNASAMAVIDSMARSLIACWKEAGPTKTVAIDAPPDLHLLITAFARADDETRRLCTIAELKPFGDDKLTTSFRAACPPP